MVMTLKKESSVEWIYRAILIAMVGATLIKVDRVSVHDQQILDLKEDNKKQDEKIDKINNALYIPAFESRAKSDSNLKHLRETKQLIDYTKLNLSELDALAIIADSSILSKCKTN